MKIKRALLSVWDKEGIIELGKFLSDQNIEILSTGGTKKVLRELRICKTKSYSSIEPNGRGRPHRMKNPYGI